MTPAEERALQLAERISVGDLIERCVGTRDRLGFGNDERIGIKEALYDKAFENPDQDFDLTIAAMSGVTTAEMIEAFRDLRCEFKPDEANLIRWLIKSRREMGLR